ncbi:MAG: spore coat polysaccharide biosynthesis protein SpsF [Anaerophaga sp.]|nr:spore coat polysaccharide biosynthesis protein SpsF [Anaerophaga sp.]
MLYSKKIFAFVYARMSSQRLPGKVLMKFYGTPLLKIITDKISSTGIRPIVLTSNHQTDDEIESYCLDNKILVYRGSLQNVALRTVSALDKYNCSYFFRVNGDSPFFQNDLIYKSLEILKHNKNIDLCTNILNRTYPYGVSIELINAESFIINYRYFLEYNQEHITSFFYENKNKFNIINIENTIDLSKYSLTVDNLSDVIRINDIIKYQETVNIFDLRLEQLITLINNYEEYLFNKTKRI